MAALLVDFWAADLPERVRHAVFRAEYATWQRYGTVSLTMIVSGLESLLKIGKSSLTRQFKRRVTALAADLDIEGVDEDFCGRMYDGRSTWVHGGRVELFNPAPGDGGDVDEGAGPDDAERTFIDDVGGLQEILRRAVRRAIEDPNFLGIFESNETIAERWPA